MMGDMMRNLNYFLSLLALNNIKGQESPRGTIFPFIEEYRMHFCHLCTWLLPWSSHWSSNVLEGEKWLSWKKIVSRSLEKDNFVHQVHSRFYIRFRLFLSKLSKFAHPHKHPNTSPIPSLFIPPFRTNRSFTTIITVQRTQINPAKSAKDHPHPYPHSETCSNSST
jgi:hypothetical protein